MAARQTRSAFDGQLGETLQNMQATLAALNQRIAANENAYERLAAAQHELAKEVNTGLADLRKAIADNYKTPWGVLVSALSATVVIIMAIGGLALSPIRDTLSETRQDAASMRTELGASINEERRRINELARELYSQAGTRR